MRNILFFDIETVPVEPDFLKLSAHGKDTFTKRFRSAYDKLVEEQPVYISSSEDDLIRLGPRINEEEYQLEIWQQVYERNVSLLAEYAKVAAISIGMVDKDDKLRLKTFSGPDEVEILTQFCAVVADQNVYKLCAHNGKGFDIPFVVRRLLIHGIKLPDKLQILNLRPWDLKWILDTIEMWNLGDMRYNCGLDRLAYAFNLPSPKGDMDGSQVASVFYSDDPERFARIGAYCKVDVVTLACVYAYMTGNILPVNLTPPTP